MSTIPARSSFVTDSEAYTVECPFCSAKAGEPCINLRSVVDSTREAQYYSSGVHKARITTYKALNNVQGIEQPAPTKLPEYTKPVIKPKAVEDVIYAHIDGLEEPLPVKAKTVEIYAVVRSTEKAILVENLNQYTACIPKSVVVSSSRNILHVQPTFQINWVKAVTE